jgi:predicted nucleotide-binding protein
MDTNFFPTLSQPPPTAPILERLRMSYTRGLSILKSQQIRKGDVYYWLNGLTGKLKDIYGQSTPIVQSFREKELHIQKNGITSEQFQLEMASLKGLIDQMEYSAGARALNVASAPSIPPSGKNVFIIHGHDELNTKRLTLLLQNNLHVNPMIIISKPGMSRPLIEKYEDSASLCSFAFALVTPDDQIASPIGDYHQARSNVIFELGWFVGRLGKHRVAILLKEGTEIHSDIHGVSRIQFRDNVEEKFLEIQRELSAC